MLAKADLTTEIVGEFPELQGEMGCRYALLQGEDDAVAAAIELRVGQGFLSMLDRQPAGKRRGDLLVVRRDRAFQVGQAPGAQRGWVG